MQDKWKSLPQIKGNLFGAYLLVKMLVQLFPEYLSYYKKTFILNRMIILLNSNTGKASGTRLSDDRLSVLTLSLILKE